MISSLVDSALAQFAARTARHADSSAATRRIRTERGQVMLFDSGGDKPCVVFVPDGPNLISHYEKLTQRLDETFRVVCFDMPGFGYSIPSGKYDHSLDHGAAAVLAVLDALDIEKAILAFSCANGFYAIRVAQIAPNRVVRLVLSQTPSLAAMHSWSNRVVPRVLHVPVVGQFFGWLFRHKAADSWYKVALPKGTEPTEFRVPALRALSCGACFSLAGVVQGLGKEDPSAIRGVNTKCTMFWGCLDRSHSQTDPNSLKDLLPHAEVVRFESAGHFPDLEESDRFADFLLEQVRADA
jgi:pimeloyl-ACP methyl ester carboxylesterase